MWIGETKNQWNQYIIIHYTSYVIKLLEKKPCVEYTRESSVPSFILYTYTYKYMYHIELY